MGRGHEGGGGGVPGKKKKKKNVNKKLTKWECRNGTEKPKNSRPAGKGKKQK